MENDLHIYCRVSTKEQSDNNTSLETQRHLGVTLSESLGIDHHIWDEGAQSSSKDDLSNRPVLVNLLSKVDEGKVKKLYVFNTDRLSRNQKTWGMIRYKLSSNKVLLFSGSDSNPIDLSNPIDDLLIGVLSEISQYDNRLRTERFRLGKLRRIKEGGWLGGPPPYGYSIEDKRLVINPSESKWIKMVYEMFSEGISIDEIRTELLKNGVKTRRNNRVWSHGSIQQLLRNTHYEGYFKVTDKKSGETVRVECDPILSKSLVSKVHRLKEKRSYKKGDGRIGGGNTKRDYLLKGLLVCGGCGKLYGGRSHKNSHLNHYYCVSIERKWKDTFTDREVKCVKSKRNMKIDITDNLVWKTVIDVVKNSVLFKENIKTEILSKSVNQKVEIESEEKKLKIIDKELKEVKKTIIDLESDKLLKKRSEDEVDQILENIDNHRLDLERRRESVVEVINGTKQSISWVDWVNEFSDRIDTLLDEEDMVVRKKFLMGLLDKIIVTSDDKQTHSLRLFFKIPYINDSLVWNDDKDRSKGYKLESGLKSLVIDFNGKIDPLKKTV